MKLKQLTTIMFLAVLSLAAYSNETVMQINGEDAALPADTAIPSFSYGDSLKGRLLDSGINFVLIENRTDGLNDTVTLFDAKDVERVCGWEGAITDDISLVFNGSDVYCTE